MRHQIEFELDYLTMFAPCAALAPYIEGYYWFHGGKMPPLLRMYPFADLSIWLHFGRKPTVIYKEQKLNVPAHYAVGLNRTAHELHFGDGIDSLNIVFRPTGAARIFALPINEIPNCVELSDVLPSSFTQESLALEALAPHQRIAPLEQLLCQHMSPIQPQAEWLHAGIALMKAHWGKLRVDDVAVAVNHSRSQLTRACKHETGLSPKQLMRQLRFLGTILDINQTPHPDFAQMALEHGYSDQSHFVNEFTRLASITPSQFIFERDHASFFQDEWGRYE